MHIRLIHTAVYGIEMFLVLYDNEGEWEVRGYMSEQYARQFITYKLKYTDHIKLEHGLSDGSKWAKHLHKTKKVRK